MKVTGKLDDGQLEFLGRLIRLDGQNIALGVKPEYVRSVFSAFGWTDKDLEKVKPTSTTPDIGAWYDAEDPQSPSKPLTPEAAGRFRSCLGKIGWLTQTRTDITYFHSMLSRGQAAPRAVHEDALRKFLPLIRFFHVEMERRMKKRTPRWWPSVIATGAARVARVGRVLVAGLSTPLPDPLGTA